jgi:nitrogen fixation/metabolism regulation signal transduction histidine kinase
MEGSIERFKKKQLHNETEYLFYDTLLNRIDSGIMVLDKQGNIRWINKAAVDILGKPQPRKLADLKNVSSGLPEMIDRLVPKEIKLLKVNKGGSENQFAVSSIFFISRGNELKLVSMKDIQPALESNESEAWRKLIRVLTHEMMNSITPIISLAETLSEVPETMDEKRYASMSRAMQTIHRRSKGLMDFVKNYQRLTRIPEPVPVNIHVSEMMADINRLLQADGIQFTYLMDAPDIRLTADRGQIEQVLINLIKNAWEAGNEKKHPDVIVQVSRNEYRKPVIEISDNGYGIVPEVLDKVFVPFFTTKQGGSGIGLSICRQIMNMHQGNITIESEMDKGTKVRLQFG